MPAVTSEHAARTKQCAGGWVLVLATISIVAACHDPNSPDAPVKPLGPEPSGARALVQATNNFSLRLFGAVQQAAGPDSNVFISPFSASVALGMTATGAKGETLDSMQAVLGYPGTSIAVMGQSYAWLLQRLNDADPKVTLRIANSLWYDQSISLLPNFTSTVQSDFDAHISEVDFANPATIGAINAWADSATLGFIPHFLDGLPPRTKLFLGNAVYFHGSWSTQFDSHKTRDTLFTTANGVTAPVRLMNGTMNVAFAQATHYKAADLPYASGAFSMTIVVPNSGVTLDQVVSELSSGGWTSLVATLDDTTNHPPVVVALPKFDLPWRDSLNASLRTLGMGVAFSDTADFSGMSTSRWRLKISQVLQATHVLVNEQGTTAAGVTGVVVVTATIPETTYTVRADHPFLYAIRERSTGAVLFLGAFTHPVGS